MITVFGATGYTGQRIARQLAVAGLPVRVAGRNPAAVHALHDTLNLTTPPVVAEATQPHTLPPLLAGTRLLINAAGPFTDLGEPVLALAAAQGVHYLDITNELAYVYRARQYHALAQARGAAVVPACAFEVAISDCLLADMAAQAGSTTWQSAQVLYAAAEAQVSYGTRLSALRSAATSWLAWRGGRMVRQWPLNQVRRGQLAGRPFAALNLPSAETVTVPEHLNVQEVGVWLAVSRRWAGPVAALMPLVAVGLRTPLGALTAWAFRHVAPPPPATLEGAFRFTIQAELTRPGQTLTRVVRGHDPYDLTAAIITYAARALLETGPRHTGVIAPALALHPADFLAWLGTVGSA